MLKILILLMAAAVASPAALIVLDVDGATLSGSDPTQTGRMVRNGTASQWAVNKPFPGLSSSSGQRAYRLFTTSVPGYGGAVFYEVALSSSFFLFAAAYTGSFNPVDLSSGYLGDAGASGVMTFQVSLPDGNTPLAIVVHEVNPGGGLGVPFDVTVTAYADASYGALPSSVPEPSTLALVGASLLSLGLLRRRRLTGTRKGA
jgi:hypothetical protein